MNEENKLTCVRCRYYCDEVEGEMPHTGECRRHAPSCFDDDLIAIFPRVLASDWCGEAGWRE
jgi:hypothetical protein